MKRIRELEQQQDQAVRQACDAHQALHRKEAQLLAAKQSVRSAVVEYMRSTPASEWTGRHWVWMLQCAYLACCLCMVCCCGTHVPRMACLLFPRAT